MTTCELARRQNSGKVGRGGDGGRGRGEEQKEDGTSERLSPVGRIVRNCGKTKDKKKGQF